jgi:multidrug efflux pump subunit AcrA (membrane-fusion protein)
LIRTILDRVRSWLAAGRSRPLSRRPLAALVAVAVTASAIGWWAGQSIKSPFEAARNARPPEAGAITVPVERRVVSTAVVVRGDLGFAEPQELTVDPDLGDGTLGKLVVTGRVPKIGAELGEGEVALQVSGRPVILLDGVLPMYRALGPGSTGPDVLQLERALRRLGHFNQAPNDAYDAATAAAVTRLYQAVGFEPVGSAQQDQQVAAARERVVAAKGTLASAQAALAEAKKGPPQSQVLSARAAVASAQTAYDAAVAERDKAIAEGASDETIAQLNAAVDAAKLQLDIAQAQLAELMASVDVAAFQKAVTAAETALAAAEADLAKLRGGSGTRVPRGEIAFVPSLPRRVDQVNVALGREVEGTVLSLTAAALEVTTAVSAEERGLLEVGQEVQLDDGEGADAFAGVVSYIADKPGTGGVLAGQYFVRVDPAGDVPPEMHGRNVRVRIPISSTGGAVLAVPLAALITNAAGEARVRVIGPDGGRDVPVEVGLSADGFAQVRATSGDLAEGDLVVVGERS